MFAPVLPTKKRGGYTPSLCGLFLFDFLLILVERIAADACLLHQLCIRQGAAKVLAMLADNSFGLIGFLYVQLASRLLTNLLAVQAGGFNALFGALVQVLHFLLCLFKGKLGKERA